MQGNPLPSPAVVKILGSALTDSGVKNELFTNCTGFIDSHPDAQGLSAQDKQDLEKIVNKAKADPDFEALSRLVHYYISCRFV